MEAAVAESAGLDHRMDKLLATLDQNSALADQLEETPTASIQALKQSGVLKCLIPSRYGGEEGDVSLVSRIVERIAAVDPSMAIIYFQHMSVASRIMEWGTDTQKAQYLPLLASGKWIAASAWSEKGAGANKQNLSTQARYKDEGYWIVNGAKTFTTGAGLADLYLVLVQTGEHAGDGIYGNAGQSFFLIETAISRVKASSKLNLSGMRGSSTGFIELEDARVPSSNLLGPLGGAPRIISGIRASGLSLGAVSVGIAQSAYQLAFQEISKRGLLDKPSIQLKLSELNMRIAAARALVAYSAGGMSDNQKVDSYQSKIFASEISEKVCRECQQIIGGSGFVREHRIDRIYRDARAIALMGPVNDLAKEIIGRELVQ